MRASGLLDSVRHLGSRDHVCWGYRDRAAFVASACEAVADGAATGHRVEYTGSETAVQLEVDLRSLPDVEELLASGQLSITPIEDAYGHEAFDPEHQVVRYAAATEEAVKAGYRGYRAVAEATALVRTIEQREVFSHYEHLIDRYMASSPFSAVCAYDIAALGLDAVAELAAFHPLTNMTERPFHLFTGASAETLVIIGEVDFFSIDLFRVALDRLPPPPDNQKLSVDARGLAFIDHNGLLALDRYAVDHGITLSLLTDRPPVIRLIDVLGLSSVHATRA